MAQSRREEERLLSSDERELVTASHGPTLNELPQADLADLLQRLRSRRDRARDVGHRQRREIRGKAPAAGRTRARDDTGTGRKISVLASALKRVGKEIQRRRDATSRRALVAQARRALELRGSSETAATQPETRTAGDGIRSIPNSDIAPSGVR